MRRPSLTETPRARRRLFEGQPSANSLRLTLSSLRRSAHTLRDLNRCSETRLRGPVTACSVPQGFRRFASTGPLRLVPRGACSLLSCCLQEKAAGSTPTAPPRPRCHPHPPWRAPLLIRKPTNHPERLAVPANSGDRSGRRRGRLFLSPNRKIRTLAAGRKTPAPQPDFRQPPVTVSWPKRPLTGQAATTTVPSRQWPQTRACDTGIVPLSSIRDGRMRMVAALQSPAGQRFAPPRMAIHTRSRPPRWGSLPASGSRVTTASRRQARPSGWNHLCFARSRQSSLHSDCWAAGTCAPDYSAPSHYIVT